MNTENIILLMQSRGWEYKEYTAMTFGDSFQICFSRNNWHGQTTNYTITVSRLGSTIQRDALVKDAAREAWGLYGQFRRPPGQFYDLETNSLVWRESPIKKEG